MAVMSLGAIKMSYSSFLRGPTTATAAVETHDVVLERRDGVDLVLTTVERAAANDDALGLGALMLRSICRSNPDMVAAALEEQLPWLAWLPPQDRVACTTELVTDLAAGASLHLFARFHADLVAWRHTAEAWADPTVADRLSGEFHGAGDPVERPTT